jgi:acetyl-CoA carboxylase carboxyltransferase component
MPKNRKIMQMAMKNGMIGLNDSGGARIREVWSLEDTLIFSC